MTETQIKNEIIQQKHVAVIERLERFGVEHDELNYYRDAVYHKRPKNTIELIELTTINPWFLYVYGFDHEVNFATATLFHCMHRGISTVTNISRTCGVDELFTLFIASQHLYRNEKTLHLSYERPYSQQAFIKLHALYNSLDMSQIYSVYAAKQQLLFTTVDEVLRKGAAHESSSILALDHEFHDIPALVTLCGKNSMPFHFAGTMNRKINPDHLETLDALTEIESLEENICAAFNDKAPPTLRFVFNWRTLEKSPEWYDRICRDVMGSKTIISYEIDLIRA